MAALSASLPWSITAIVSAPRTQSKYSSLAPRSTDDGHCSLSHDPLDLLSLSLSLSPSLPHTHTNR
jgi:hypothetical protein